MKRDIADANTETRSAKTIARIRISDLRRHPVWRHASGDTPDETGLVPVRAARVAHRRGRLVGARVALANGRKVWAFVGNVHVDDPERTRHVMTVAVHEGGRWFPLARYHDADYKRRGPAALSAFLGFPIDDVFPIHYDLRPYCAARSESLVGDLDKAPRVRLSRSDIISMAVPKNPERRSPRAHPVSSTTSRSKEST